MYKYEFDQTGTASYYSVEFGWVAIFPSLNGRHWVDDMYGTKAMLVDDFGNLVDKPRKCFAYQKQEVF